MHQTGTRYTNIPQWTAIVTTARRREQRKGMSAENKQHPNSGKTYRGNHKKTK